MRWQFTVIAVAALALIALAAPASNHGRNATSTLTRKIVPPPKLQYHPPDAAGAGIDHRHAAQLRQYHRSQDHQQDDGPIDAGGAPGQRPSGGAWPIGQLHRSHLTDRGPGDLYDASDLETEAPTASNVSAFRAMPCNRSPWSASINARRVICWRSAKAGERAPTGFRLSPAGGFA